MEVLLQKGIKKKKGVGLHYNGFWPILGLFKKLDPIFTRTYVLVNSKIFLNFLNLAVNSESWVKSCYTHHELVFGFQNPISPEL